MGSDRFTRAFKGERPRKWTFDEAVVALGDELEGLGARNLVLSSNFERDIRGVLRPGRQRPDDQSIAVYFELRGKALVMACDRFVQAEGNLRSLALAIEAMRQLERHGGGTMMERAFAGFAALAPPSSGRPWHQVLDLEPSSSTALIEQTFRRLAAERHPDKGGSADAMAELNQARAEALRERG